MSRVIFSTLLAVFMLLSCQSADKRAAQAAIDRYVIFVDSVNEAKFTNRRDRWNFIAQEQLRKKRDAEEALKMYEGNSLEKQRSRINKSDDKYLGVKTSLINK